MPERSATPHAVEMHPFETTFNAAHSVPVDPTRVHRSGLAEWRKATCVAPVWGGRKAVKGGGSGTAG